MGHRISLDDFKDFSFEHELAGVYGKVLNKKLVVRVHVLNLNTEFRVYNQRQEVARTTSLSAAIEAYNEAD